MSASMVPPDQIIAQALFSNATEQGDRVQNTGQRMVHYTSAQVAHSIIAYRKLWLRNAIAMNDYSEVEYGERCLLAAWNSVPGGKFKALLNSELPGIVDEIQQGHDLTHGTNRSEVYMLCVSEHLSPAEDSIGRLSMWRAYGGDCGVALVVGHQALFRPISDLKAYSSPVAYLTQEQFVDEFAKIGRKLAAHRDLLKTVGRQRVLELVLRAFRFAVVSTKHPGFREEKEWRVIYMPKLETSELVDKSIEVVGGVPQVVYHLPLRDLALLDRIIIGPTKLPRTVRDAFVDMLVAAGVADAASKVFSSDIPLRR